MQARESTWPECVCPARFCGLMDETTVFSIPNPAGGGISGPTCRVRASLINTPLGTVDFRGVDLSGVNLSNSDLNNALLTSIPFFHAVQAQDKVRRSTSWAQEPTPANIPFASRFPRRKLGGRKFKQRRPQQAQPTTRLSSPPPIQEAGRTSATCPIRMARGNPFRDRTQCGLASQLGQVLSTRFSWAYGRPRSSPSPTRPAEISGPTCPGPEPDQPALGTVDFRGVNLAGVNLSNADLSNAQFDQHTVFSSHDGGTGQSAAANLLGTGANLSNIPFVSVDFRGVNLAGVNLTNADLSSAQFDHQTMFSAPNPEAGRTSRPTCTDEQYRSNPFRYRAQCRLRGVNLAGVRLSTPGFNGLMDQTTIFSIPNPAGRGNIGAVRVRCQSGQHTWEPSTSASQPLGREPEQLRPQQRSFRPIYRLFDRFIRRGRTSAGANLLGANLSNIPHRQRRLQQRNLAGVSNADLSSAQFDHQTIFSAPNPGGGPNFAANLSNTNGTGTVLSGIAQYGLSRSQLRLPKLGRA